MDMGMMGRLTDRDRELIGQAIQGIAMNDIGIIQDVVLELESLRSGLIRVYCMKESAA